MNAAAEIPALRWRPWILAAILALLFHVLVLFPRIPGLLLAPPKAPPRVDVQQVDPRKLEAIRKQWRSREKQLLIDQGLKSPTAKEPPPDARYMSDRNIRVEKEQRAKQTNVVPRPGRPGEPAASQPAQPEIPAEPKTAQPPKRQFPSLGNLGVPLPAAPKKSVRPPRPAANTPGRTYAAGGDDGGAQALLEPNLPEGSENLLNAQESVYYSFYSRLYEAIGPIWQSKIRAASRMRRLQPGDYTTQVDVVFDRAGNLLAVNPLKSSGIDEFDRAAQASWRSIGRFPNPPSGLLNEEGQVHTGWTFTVQLKQGMNLDAPPPERVY